MMQHRTRREIDLLTGLLSETAALATPTRQSRIFSRGTRSSTGSNPNRASR
jgi:hypothetical protein